MRIQPSTPLTLLAAAAFIGSGLPAAAQEATESIRLNQIGFYPAAPKSAFVVGAPGDAFHVMRVDNGETVFTGQLAPPVTTDASSDTTRAADFGDVATPGRYVVSVPGLGQSAPFDIRSRVHEPITLAALKAFYFQRASTPLEPEHAETWSRDAGHPDTVVLVHPSAATPERPAGTVISSPGGWYDAGDYNKYVVNSGITVATLFSLYEDFPDYVETLDVGIPESAQSAPDLLHEAVWNLRWLLTMQDPHDGGVYHKLTAADFEGFVMPADANATRYVVQKSTAATLDLAAVAAQASRILRAHEDAWPGLADSALTAATHAWRWARANPDSIYDQDRLNELHDPDISTGTYGDRSVDDELAWAATELSLTTGQDSFYTAVPVFADDDDGGYAPLPSWSQVRTLGYYSLARFRDALPQTAAADRERLEGLLIALADSLAQGASRSAYDTPMGQSAGDFIWGSNSVAANQGIALITGYRLTGEARFLRRALDNLDYLLGRNATGYSFVTGHGTKTPMQPHHRASDADEVTDPIPGLLAGGPNEGRQDGCEYPQLEPDRSYVDDTCSYASNEIAINWNAPLVYLAAAIEALQLEFTTENTENTETAQRGSLTWRRSRRMVTALCDTSVCSVPSVVSSRPQPTSSPYGGEDL